MKYYLYPNAAYHVFTDCFEKAGVTLVEKDKMESLGWNKLRDDIKKKIEYQPLNEAGRLYTNDDFWLKYHDHLRDRFREICESINEDTEHKKKGFGELKFLPLLKYLAVTDYEVYNDRYKPVSIKPADLALAPETLVEKQAEITEEVVEDITPSVISQVFYTSRPFSRFNFLRIPDDEGSLYFYGNANVEYKGEDKNIKIASDAIRPIETFSMNDGPESLWVKIEYEENGQLVTAYFAEYEPWAEGLKLSSPQNLIKHFNQLLSVQEISV